MRRFSTFVPVLLLASSLLAPAAHSGVILSELCDPQQHYMTDRFIEVYNTGPDAVNLAGWQLVAIANNDSVAVWNLSGVLNVGQARVAGGTSTVTGFTVDFPSAVWSTSAGYGNWNGRAGDGAKLRSASGVVVDIVVATVSPTFENADYVRDSNVTEPSGVYAPSEWSSSHVELATDASPGSHNGSLPPPGGPSITNIVTDPASPTAGTSVDVEADVVDLTGPIAAVDLAWGTTSSSLTNSISMSVLSGSTYRTITPIPGQGPGTTVYYQVQAVGASATSQSSIRSYAIPGTAGAPTVLSVGEMSDSTLLVFFSEPVDETTAEVAANYAVGALYGVAAVRDPDQTSQVLVTVRGLTAGARTLTVNGVEDLDGNAAGNATRSFTYVDVTTPPGYYNGTAGLRGSALRSALHTIIDNHTVRSYDYAHTAFRTTDVKPNGKVWDVYSDIPGGTPPYEYSFGQTNPNGSEGSGYNREHTWPQSWFNGNSPMYSDLWILYPTDARVNNDRANLPYGEVGTATTTSLNGSKSGTSAGFGYGGQVFEPIDPYKGDLARTTFYVATRYFGEDSGWDSTPATVGANLLPWAADLYLQWSRNDPVSWKERLRNGAIYTIQGNRNPFVDHPEFVALIYDSSGVLAADDAPRAAIALRRISPNPFAARTTIHFDLTSAQAVSLDVHDVTGRRVRRLATGRSMNAGSHAVEWDGRDEAGAPVAAGLYFCSLNAGSMTSTRRMVLSR